MSKVDKTWSIKDEKYIELVKEIKKVNDKLMENKMKTSEIIKGLMKLGDILDNIEMGEQELEYYQNVIWNAVNLITIEKETIK